jgi:predicted SAM-dependent methyltransferase
MINFIQKIVISKNFLSSKQYSLLMHLFFDKKNDGTNSAQNKTANFRLRHFKLNKILGAWRWLGIFEQRHEIMPYIFSEKKGLDFGGARGPISLQIKLCDRLKLDVFKRKVAYNSLKEISDRSLDYIWTSHTLEHIDSLSKTLSKLKDKLVKGGVLFLHVPSYTCFRWQSGIHNYKDEKGDSSHNYTFYLSKDKSDNIENSYTPIDSLILESGFKIKKAEYVADNSIFIKAIK